MEPGSTIGSASAHFAIDRRLLTEATETLDGGDPAAAAALLDQALSRPFGADSGEALHESGTRIQSADGYAGGDRHRRGDSALACRRTVVVASSEAGDERLAAGWESS